MPQPRSVAAAASNHVSDWDNADRSIRRLVTRILGGDNPGTRTVIGTVRDATARLEAKAATWARDELSGIYRLGAQIAADVTGLDSIGDLMDAEVAAILAEHVDDTTTIGQALRRTAASFEVPSGLPVLSPAEIRALTPGELRDLLQHPLGLVRYSDGSYRTVADHGDMLTRTRAALTYNQGTIDVARLAGSTSVVVRDGTGCGISAHNDGSVANGMVWELEFAEAHPLAHPRCQRSFQPLPAGTSARQAAKVAAQASTIPLDVPLPLPGPVIVARPRVQRSRPTRQQRARRRQRR